MIEATVGPRQDASVTAGLIHRTALEGAQRRLWQAALGSIDELDTPDLPRPQAASGDIDALVLLSQRSAAPVWRPQPAAPIQLPPASASTGVDPVRLGANARHADALTRAADRTGIPASAIAAIVDAEAAKDHAGRWNAYSRNPRSSAAGLGQFLSGTWKGMAETRGTWLNATAARHGWLDARGQVRAEARSQLLALRYDPAASIETTADYAQANLNRLRRAGVPTAADETDIARNAYLAHHLGAGDAARFLKTGLEDAHARTLLRAQIGSARADRAIANAGDASAAHRAWLVSYVNRKIQPERFG